jgi:putative (di)nucleoside polyphosphate hydrolase
LSEEPQAGYRPCVGVMVLNKDGLVFVGCRVGYEDDPHAWQLPQGGVDEDEELETAALRELLEETGISSVELLGQSRQWISYDLPEGVAKGWKRKFKGQSQKWFVYQFLGQDSEINLNYTKHVEFSQWRWVPVEEIINMVVPFKRAVYESVVSEFSHLAKPRG